MLSAAAAHTHLPQRTLKVNDSSTTNGRSSTLRRSGRAAKAVVYRYDPLPQADKQDEDGDYDEDEDQDKDGGDDKDDEDDESDDEDDETEDEDEALHNKPSESVVGPTQTQLRTQHPGSNAIDVMSQAASKEKFLPRRLRLLLVACPFTTKGVMDVMVEDTHILCNVALGAIRCSTLLDFVFGKGNQKGKRPQ